MRKKCFLLFIGLFALFFSVARAGAHCEIPCGIYDDEMRIRMILEHVQTIEKSMNEILALQKKEQDHANQLIRWVMNKENHAEQLQEIVSQYFMTQRIKPDSQGYEKKLSILHQMLIYAMKCKQTTDLDHVQKLRNLVGEFKNLYFAKE